MSDIMQNDTRAKHCIVHLSSLEAFSPVLQVTGGVDVFPRGGLRGLCFVRWRRKLVGYEGVIAHSLALLGS